MKTRKDKNDQGYVILGVLVMLALTMLVTMGMLDASGTNAKTRAIVTTQADYYYEVEETVNRVVAWLQDNSKNIVTAFNEANFTNNFDLGVPAVGDNEGEHFAVPTMVKMKGTNNSVILSKNSFFGTSAFPATTNIDDGTAFDANTAFGAASLGPANARVVLVWARHTNTNYEPIFRIDVITGNNPDRGVHSYSFVYSTLVTADPTMGFYGRDYLTLTTGNNTCGSFQYSNTAGVWSRGAPRSNCPAGSDEILTTKAKISGTAKTLEDNGIVLQGPGGSVSGTMCDGPGCHTYSLPALGNWDSYCSGVTTDLTIAANTVLAPGCYRNITINANRTLTLSNTGAPYYIKFIDFIGNGSNVSFGTIPVGQKVTLYVGQLNNNNTINGNKVVNGTNAPHQVVINYIGSNALTLNGTAQMSSVITAPFAHVEVSGNFNYYGGILAASLTAIGNSTLNYDESITMPPALSDMNFALRKTSQRYR